MTSKELRDQMTRSGNNLLDKIEEYALDNGSAAGPTEDDVQEAFFEFAFYNGDMAAVLAALLDGGYFDGSRGETLAAMIVSAITEDIDERF